MNILITGANGFLGHHTVSAFLNRGHQVRALVRPTANINKFQWPNSVEVVRADLRSPRDLTPLFDNIDALVHLAAAVTGGEEHQFVSTVVGTERLLDVMARSQTRRLVLASSFSVYDWSKIHGTLSEDSPLEPSPDLYARDGYAIAKLWQEKIARQRAAQNNWDLTVLRPGFIWGKSNEYLAGLGQSLGKFHLTISPLARLPLTHVANCADAFATATLDPRAINQTFNVLDPFTLRVGRYFRLYRRYTHTRQFSIPIPYLFGKALTHLATLTSKTIYHGKGKLPSLLVPCRYQARFKPLRFKTNKLHEVLNWNAPHNLQDCLRLTYNPESREPNSRPVEMPQLTT